MDIDDKAKIFTRSEEKLTQYQKEINSASIELCRINPTLLMGGKGDLLKLARERVHNNGYIYKKGKSRAKRLGSSTEDGSTSESFKAKRVRIDGRERELRMNHLLDQIADIERRITFKQCRIDSAAASKNFKACDELSQELSDLRTQKHDLNCLLAPLQKKSAKSAWYYKSKQKNGDEADVSDNLLDTSRETSVESNDGSGTSFLHQSLLTETQQQLQ